MKTEVDRKTVLAARRARVRMPRTQFYEQMLPGIFIGLGLLLISLILGLVGALLGVGASRTLDTGPTIGLNAALPFLSTVIMVVFATSVLSRWAARRSPAFLFWGVGLTLFALAALAEAYFAVRPFNTAMFVLWYAGGALLSAAWIGHGTFMLLVRRPLWRRLVSGLLVAGSLAAVALMLRTPLDPAQAVVGAPVSEWYRNVLPPGAPIRLTTPFFNIYGTLTLAGGALWSSFLFWRKRVMPDRVLGNVLIAVGTLVIASASTLTRFGVGHYLYLGELLAAALMFAGFRFAAAPAPAAPQAAPAEA